VHARQAPARPLRAVLEPRKVRLSAPLRFRPLGTLPLATRQGSLYEEDPWLAHAVVDFVPRLASMTQNLITGMLVHSQAEATSKTGKTDP
jgi:hypothetical protein